MPPKPSTRVPSLTTAMVLPRLVCVYALEASAWMARHGAATPGVYQTAKSSSPSIGHFGAIWILPRYSSWRRSASSEDAPARFNISSLVSVTIWLRFSNERKDRTRRVSSGAAGAGAPGSGKANDLHYSAALPGTGDAKRTMLKNFG